jgi:hypothetical protein
MRGLQRHSAIGRLVTLVIGIFVSVALLRGAEGPELLTLGNTILLLAVLRILVRLTQTSPLTAKLSVIASNRSLLALIRQVVEAGARAAAVGDPIHRELVLWQLTTASARFEEAVGGRVAFASTERWRSVYEQLLTSRGLHVYRSVALVRDESYWRTEAGLNSMQLNLRLAEFGQLGIERIVILNDELWPVSNQLPVSQLQQWIHEQHHHGILLRLVRESELKTEPDLLCDTGIYGSRAIGIQELDEDGATRQFTLQFGLEHVQAAEERWQRLLVYAVKYSDFLDRYSVSS